MLFEANEARFLFTVSGQSAAFQVLRFQGEESISQNFEFSITLVSESTTLDLAKFLYQTCTLRLKTPQGYRDIVGVVHAFSQGDTGLRLTEYQVVMKPRLALLAYRTNYRIFQQKTVREIVEQLLQEAGMTTQDYQWRLHNTLTAREYCVQYAETDFDFIHRLLSEEGIHYHYASQGGQTCLLFGDGNYAFAKSVTLGYSPASGMTPDEPALRECQTFWRTVSGKVSGRDFTFTRPFTPLQGQATPVKPAQNNQSQLTADSKPTTTPHTSELLEDYRWPALGQSDAELTSLSQLAQARHLQDSIELAGVTDHAGLASGTFATFNQLPRTELDPVWLVTRVWHEGEQPQVLEETNGSKSTYQNKFAGIPWQTQFIPAWWHHRPLLSGYQTAIVTGPKGEEIYTDAWGRIKVQFHWDREGQADEKTSCWIRLAQGWAGDRYGSHWVPRVGQEVVVSFEHGNPDRPLVLGCVYNGANAHPYALPEHKTRTTYKTLTTPGGGGFNELRFEDKKGSEQIFLHAQRDWELMVKANAYATIDGDSHRLTHGNAIERVRGDRQNTIDQSSYEQLDADDQCHVKGVQQQQIDQSFLVTVGDELHQNAAVKVSLEAGAGVTLKVGGSFITIGPGGVQMVAGSIALGGGPAALNGTPVSLSELLKPVGPVIAEARAQQAAAAKVCPYRKKE